METGSLPSHDNVDFLKLQQMFFAKLEQENKSQNTLKNYRTDLDCFHHYLLEKKHADPLAKFSLPHVKAYGEYLEDKYSSDNSRRRRVQALRLFFDFLVEQKIFPSNPVRLIPTSPKFLDRPRPTPFVDVKTLWFYLLEEEKQNSEMGKLTSLRNQVIMLLIYEAGLKVSDLASLKRSDLFLDGSPRVMLTPPKREPYTIPLLELFKTVFLSYEVLLKRALKKVDIDYDFVLFNANPHRILAGGLSSRGLEMIFEHYRKKLMIVLTPKSLRQACIFKWLGEEKPESLMKEWLGFAPSYSLKPYSDLKSEFQYNPDALVQITQQLRKH